MIEINGHRCESSGDGVIVISLNPRLLEDAGGRVSLTWTDLVGMLRILDPHVLVSSGKDRQAQLRQQIDMDKATAGMYDFSRVENRKDFADRLGQMLSDGPRMEAGFHWMLAHGDWETTPQHQWALEAYTPIGGERFVGKRLFGEATHNVWRTASGVYLAAQATG